MGPTTGSTSPRLSDPATPTLKRSRTVTLSDSDLFPTPKHSRDIHHSIQKLRDDSAGLTLEQKAVLALEKAGKALSNATTDKALLKASNSRLQTQLDELHAKGRKKR